MAVSLTTQLTWCNYTDPPANLLILGLVPEEGAPVVPRNSDKDAYFGDLNVHSSYSFNAFLFGVRAQPDGAYRVAQGASLNHIGGFEMKL